MDSIAFIDVVNKGILAIVNNDSINWDKFSGFSCDYDVEILDLRGDLFNVKAAVIRILFAFFCDKLDFDIPGFVAGADAYLNKRAGRNLVIKLNEVTIERLR